MQRPENIPHMPGVFAVLHGASRAAYINATADLHQRAILWAHHLRANDRDPTHSVRVRNWPRHPADEWTFWFTVSEPVAAVQEAFKAAGWQSINTKTRSRTLHTVQGITDTLIGHCRRLKASSGVVYKRVERGETVEQALGLVDRTKLEPREQTITLMPVKIMTNDGEGLLTYDEAVMMRPELGNVRAKIIKLRRADPGVTSVKLSEIPL